MISGRTSARRGGGRRRASPTPAPGYWVQPLGVADLLNGGELTFELRIDFVRDARRSATTSWTSWRSTLPAPAARRASCAVRGRRHPRQLQRLRAQRCAARGRDLARVGHGRRSRSAGDDARRQARRRASTRRPRPPARAPPTRGRRPPGHRRADGLPRRRSAAREPDLAEPPAAGRVPGATSNLFDACGAAAPRFARHRLHVAAASTAAPVTTGRAGQRTDQARCSARRPTVAPPPASTSETSGL